MKEFEHGSGKFLLDSKPLIMGILNVTPDSFSDGGKFFDSQRAVSHCKRMIADGADIIDIGAMSTRPGSVPVTPEEEIGRLRDVLSVIVATGATVSVDTVNPKTAEYAFSCGASIVNDVSGVFRDEMAAVVKKYNAGWIITHSNNRPSGEKSFYANGVTECVKMFFEDFLKKSEAYGIEKSHICLDPGFGFSKNTEENINLLKNLDMLVSDGVAFMVALSRKRFLGDITGVTDAADRDGASLSANFFALTKGADILRVHNVFETKQMISIYNGIYN